MSISVLRFRALSSRPCSNCSFLAILSLVVASFSAFSAGSSSGWSDLRSWYVEAGVGVVAVDRLDDAEPALFQVVADELADVGLVVDREEAFLGQGAHGRRIARRRPRRQSARRIGAARRRAAAAPSWTGRGGLE